MLRKLCFIFIILSFSSILCGFAQISNPNFQKKNYTQTKIDSNSFQNNIDKASYFSIIQTTKPKNYISFLGGIGTLPPLLFEAGWWAQYYIHFNDSSRWLFEFSAGIIVRMERTESYPILPPNYIPQGKIYYKLNEKNKISFINFQITHTSDGENNHFATDGIENFGYGSFTTNFLQLGYNFSPIMPNQNWNTFHHFSFSYNVDIVRDKYFSPIYDKVRLNYGFQLFNYLYLPNKICVLGNKKHEIHLYIDLSLLCEKFTWNRLKQGRSSTISIMLNYKPYHKTDFSLFAQYYFGEDYYNLYFTVPLQVFRVGISASPTTIFQKTK